MTKWKYFYQSAPQTGGQWNRNSPGLWRLFDELDKFARMGALNIVIAFHDEHGRASIRHRKNTCFILGCEECRQKEQ
jgi:hypothetical protein